MVLALQGGACTGAVAHRVLRHRKSGSRWAKRSQVRLTRVHMVLDNVLLLEKLMQNLGSGDLALLKWGIRRNHTSNSGMAAKIFELPGTVADSFSWLNNGTGGVLRRQRAVSP